MIYTTYFDQLGNLPTNIVPVSIARKPPIWYNGLDYKKLAPTEEILTQWKKSMRDQNAQREYINKFMPVVLKPLSVKKVLSELENLLPEEIRAQMDNPFYTDQTWNIALVCYEQPGEFCHRHLVSQWLAERGVPCPEWGYSN